MQCGVSVLVKLGVQSKLVQSPLEHLLILLNGLLVTVGPVAHGFSNEIQDGLGELWGVFLVAFGEGTTGVAQSMLVIFHGLGQRNIVAKNVLIEPLLGLVPVLVHPHFGNDGGYVVTAPHGLCDVLGEHELS